MYEALNLRPHRQPEMPIKTYVIEHVELTHELNPNPYTLTPKTKLGGGKECLSKRMALSTSN